ncbi:unannotated protein [freshwater metagenome]|uniref:Unannotated protein n=1 Tax=freshwater metagenome TaxID=449393 RepID=A0A6J7FUI8_9ZZZZ|nr:hypothetical protein [Actinomycetota bacterium]
MSPTAATLIALATVVFGSPVLSKLLEAFERRSQRKRDDAAAPDPEIEGLKRRNGQLAEALQYDEARVAQLEEDLDERTSRLRAEEARNDELREQLVKSREQTEALRVDVAAMTTQIRELTAEVALLRGQIERG